MFILNRKKHFNFCCPWNWKKVHKIKQTESDCEKSSNLEFFEETISIQDPLNINAMKNESAVWSITLTSYGLPMSYKTNTGVQYNVVLLKISQRLHPQPKLHLMNLKPSAYNNSEILVIGKCSLTQAHKNKLFNVSFLILTQSSTHSRIRIMRKSRTYQT